MNKLPLFIFAIISFPVLLNAQMPAGAIAVYQLDNTAYDISGNNYSGSLASASLTTNRFNDPDAASAFTSGSSIGTLPAALVTAVQNDFTIGFWFRTNMIAATSAQWYGGRALVDAEMCGGTLDWGTALIDGGKVCFGIGFPDITIKSTSGGYNDGNWHFVTAVRNRSSQTITLYMNGLQVASSGGTTPQPLSAPFNIRLGANPCVPTGVFTGAMDDLIFYNRALNSSEVTALYDHLNAVVLPLTWLSFTGEVQGNSANLQWQVEAVENNDRFEIEHSIDGIHFSKKGTVRDGGETTTAPEKFQYSFLDNDLATGAHFYRIRQVDKDGRSSLSKTIQLKVNLQSGGFYLRSNPVAHELVLINVNNIKVQQLQVSDLSGKRLLQINKRSSDGVIRTNVSALQNGYYLLRISSINGEITIPWIKK